MHENGFLFMCLNVLSVFYRSKEKNSLYLFQNTQTIYISVMWCITFFWSFCSMSKIHLCFSISYFNSKEISFILFNFSDAVTMVIIVGAKVFIFLKRGVFLRLQELCHVFWPVGIFFNFFTMSTCVNHLGMILCKSRGYVISMASVDN